MHHSVRAQDWGVKVNLLILTAELLDNAHEAGIHDVIVVSPVDGQLPETVHALLTHTSCWPQVKMT